MCSTSCADYAMHILKNLPETDNDGRKCKGSQILYCTFIEFC